ncbi:MAG: RDD family protein [Promethearchaeota archaeon]
MVKYCPACGSELDTDTQFCSSCGADLRERIPEAIGEPPNTELSPPKEKVAVSEKEKKRTPTGVKYADFGERFIAFIIDAVIVGIAYAILFATVHPLVAAIISYAIALLYFWILEISTDGQTVGKMAMKIKTVNQDTLKAASTGDYLLNNLFKANPVLLIIDFIIGIIVNSSDPKKKIRIMENASNTAVIHI